MGHYTLTYLLLVITATLTADQAIYTLAKECSSVIKIGNSNTLNYQELFSNLSKPTTPRFLDIQPNNLSDTELHTIKVTAVQHQIDYTFWRANDTYIMLETSDMLVIDAHHSHAHLNYELNTFASRVRKYICVKNATGPWEYQDDDLHYRGFNGYPTSCYRGCNGTRLAVANFLQNNPEWEEIYHQSHTVLKRRSTANLYETANDKAVNEILKNKIILCTGPSFARYELLCHVTEADSQVIPFKKIFVITNDPKIANITFKNKNSVCKVIPNESHQLGCTNCIIENLKCVAEDSSVLDDDIVLFKHETVFINDMNLIKKAVAKLTEDYEMVACYWEPSNFKPKFTDAFFLKVSAIRKLTQFLYPISALCGQDCEHYLTGQLFNRIKVYEIPCHRQNGEHTELGFYHIPPRTYGNLWDKSNYATLFE